MTGDSVKRKDGPVSPKRFSIELFIIHPTLKPEEISAGIGLEPRIVHAIGTQRKTPKGVPLPGAHNDTRWRHSREYQTDGQWFRDKLVELLEAIEHHEAFFRAVKSAGGSAQIIVQFLDGYFGDEIGTDVLRRIADLGLSLGIESYRTPQSP